MKLIVEITTKDDKVQTHECVDFRYCDGPFFLLHKADFVRERVPTETITRVRQYFKQA